MSSPPPDVTFQRSWLPWKRYSKRSRMLARMGGRRLVPNWVNIFVIVGGYGMVSFLIGYDRLEPYRIPPPPPMGPGAFSGKRFADDTVKATAPVKQSL